MFSLAIVSSTSHISSRVYSFCGLCRRGSSFDFLSSSGHACISSALSFAEQIGNCAFKYKEDPGSFTHNRQPDDQERNTGLLAQCINVSCLSAWISLSRIVSEWLET